MRKYGTIIYINTVSVLSILAPSDYTAISRHIITFVNFDKEMTFDVTISDDSTNEGTESFLATATIDYGVAIIPLGRNISVVNIIDNDGNYSTSLECYISLWSSKQGFYVLVSNAYVVCACCYYTKVCWFESCDGCLSFLPFSVLFFFLLFLQLVTFFFPFFFFNISVGTG